MSILLSIGDDVIHRDPKIVLFDKDGTLVDMHHYWSIMVGIRANQIVKKWPVNHADQLVYRDIVMNAMGLDLVSGCIKPEGPVGIETRSYIIKIVADVVRGYKWKNVTDDDVESVFKIADQLISDNLKSMLKLLPGVEDLLKQLKHCGVRAVIVSADITVRVEKIIHELNLSSYFSEIIGGDLVSKSKPAPDLSILALSKTGLTVDDAVVIGDHLVDINMGVNAGISTNIGVLTGISNKSSFLGQDCFVVNDLRSIRVTCTDAS